MTYRRFVIFIALMLPLSSCFFDDPVPAPDPSPNPSAGLMCCEVSCSGNGMGPWCARRARSCPVPETNGPVADSLCQ
jgi:hypothetical protein